MSKWESEGKLFRYSNLFYWLKTMGIWTILCITICFDACRAVVLWYICIMWRHISQVLGIYNFAFVSHFIVFKRDNYLVIIICVLFHPSNYTFGLSIPLRKYIVFVAKTCLETKSRINNCVKVWLSPHVILMLHRLFVNCIELFLVLHTHFLLL